MRLFGVVRAASRAISLSKEGAGVLRSAEASEEEKEAAARRLSVKLLLQFGSIMGRTLAALLVPAVLLVLLDEPGLVPLEGVVEALESWTVILLSLLFIPLLMVRLR
jgi:hypothetical protein